MQHITIGSTSLHMLGHNLASLTLVTSFELLHVHIQCMTEHSLADYSGEWLQVRASIESASPELLLTLSTDQADQLEYISYQAADMWAVGMLLVLMLTGAWPFLHPDMAGNTSLPSPDEITRKAFVTELHEQWVCVWTDVHCAPGCIVLHADV